MGPLSYCENCKKSHARPQGRCNIYKVLSATQEEMDQKEETSRAVQTTVTPESPLQAWATGGAGSSHQGSGEGGIDLVLSKLQDLASRMTNIEAQIHRPQQTVSSGVSVVNTRANQGNPLSFHSARPKYCNTNNFYSAFSVLQEGT